MDLRHFQNKLFRHFINQQIFLLQNLNDFKYISNNLLQNEKIV